MKSFCCKAKVCSERLTHFLFTCKRGQILLSLKDSLPCSWEGFASADAQRACLPGSAEGGQGAHQAHQGQPWQNATHHSSLASPTLQEPGSEGGFQLQLGLSQRRGVDSTIPFSLPNAEIGYSLTLFLGYFLARLDLQEDLSQGLCTHNEFFCMRGICKFNHSWLIVICLCIHRRVHSEA